MKGREEEKGRYLCESANETKTKRGLRLWAGVPHGANGAGSHDGPRSISFLFVGLICFLICTMLPWHDSIYYSFRIKILIMRWPDIIKWINVGFNGDFYLFLLLHSFVSLFLWSLIIYTPIFMIFNYLHVLIKFIEF